MLTHPIRLFSGDYISAPMGCWPLKFLHALQPPKLYFQLGAGHAQVGLCPIFLVFISTTISIKLEGSIVYKKSNTRMKPNLFQFCTTNPW